MTESALAEWRAARARRGMTTPEAAAEAWAVVNTQPEPRSPAPEDFRAHMLRHAGTDGVAVDVLWREVVLGRAAT